MTRDSEIRAAYRPTRISFAPTHECNLTCAHCRVPRGSPQLLPLSLALSCVTQAQDIGIASIAFTGGEPMLAYEWVAKVTQAAASIGMEVDDLSTNGVWWDSLEELEERLRVLKDSGFGGGFHLSVDTFHAGAGSWKQAEFVRTAIRVFGTAGNLSCAETPRHPAMPAISRLARRLNARVVEESAATGRLEVHDVAVPYFRFPIADVGQGCNAAVSIGEKWFEGFDCYGHDSVLLDPTGQAHFCLGFAAYRAAPLRLGNVAEDGLAAVILAAATNPLVDLLCAEGPAGLRRVIGEHEPHAFPHPWASPCAFCYHCLTDEGLLSVLRDEGVFSETDGS